MIEKVFKNISLILFFLGVSFIINSEAVITGAVVSVSIISSTFSSLIGFFLILISGVLFVLKVSELEKKIVLTSQIKGYDKLVEETKKATNDPRIQKEMNHLILELSKGNLEAGIGKQHVSETDIWYLRGRYGARLFYHKVGENKDEIEYEIVAKSSKKNEDGVIKFIRKHYRR